MDMDYLLSLKYLSLIGIVIVPLGTPIKEAGNGRSYGKGHKFQPSNYIPLPGAITVPEYSCFSLPDWQSIIRIHFPASVYGILPQGISKTGEDQ
jgi:hypothetical protein